jgi:hypothetical protein
LKYLPEKLEESSTPGSNTHRSSNYNPHIFSSRAGKKHMMNGFFLMTKLAFGVPFLERRAPRRSRQGRLGATPRTLVRAASDPLGLPRRRRRKPPGEALAVDGGGGAFPRISPGSLGRRPRRESAACSRTSLPGSGGACGLPCRWRISACGSGACERWW